jgi:hypothetical protein
MTTTIAGTMPYAWPWDGAVDPLRTALLVITPFSGTPLVGTPAGDRVAAIADMVQAVGGTVMHVVTVPPARAEKGSTVVVDPTWQRVCAQGIDGFFGSSLDARLRSSRRDQLLLTGVGLETCVHSTMRSANDRGYECLLVLDACLAYDDDLVASSRSQVEMAGGIFGAVGTTDNVIAAYAALVKRGVHS